VRDPQDWFERPAELFALEDHFLQEKTGRRRRDPGRVRRRAGEKSAKVLDRDLAATDADEAAHKPTDHLPEKMRRPQSHEDQVPGLGENHLLHEHQRRGVLLDALVGETGVVAHAREPRGGLSHDPTVEAVLHPPDEGLAESGAATRDLIEVRTAEGVMAGVEPVVDVTGVDDIDVLGQTIVEPVEELLDVHWLRRLQVGDLPERVHTGVGSPRPLNVNRRAEELAGGPQQFTLNGTGILLPLPPVVACTLIFDGEAVAHTWKNTSVHNRILDKKRLSRKDVADLDKDTVGTSVNRVFVNQVVRIEAALPKKLRRSVTALPVVTAIDVIRSKTGTQVTISGKSLLIDIPGASS